MKNWINSGIFKNLTSAVVRAPRTWRQVKMQGSKTFSAQAYLRYVEQENGENDAADLPVSTFECRTIAGVRLKVEAKEITITVKLFAFFRENRFKQQDQTILPGSTVREIIIAQGIDPEEVGVTMINSRHCTLDHKPVQGDQLAIFPVIGGG